MWTDRSIKALKPRKQRYRESASSSNQRGVGRLTFEVQPNGARTAYFQYFLNGARKLERIGLYSHSAKSAGLTLSEIQTEQTRLSKIHQKHGDVGAFLKREGAKAERAVRLEQSVQVELRTVLETYINQKDLKPGTVTDYRKAIGETFNEYLDRPITDITRQVISTLYRKRSKESPARANNAMRVFKALYTYHRAVTRQDDGNYLLPENPVSILSETSVLKKIKRKKSYIENDQLKPWFNTVLGMDDRTYSSGEVVRDCLLFILLTGVRLEEATSLATKQVDLKRARFKLLDTKNREDVEIPMSDYVVALLKRRIESNFDAKYVFPGRDVGKPIGSFKRPLKNLREESGIDFTVHDLRRTFVTMAESLDISVYTLKRLVNHKINESNDVTAGYVGIDIERMRKATQKVTDEVLKHAGIRKKTAEIIRLSN